MIPKVICIIYQFFLDTSTSEGNDKDAARHELLFLSSAAESVHQDYRQNGRASSLLIKLMIPSFGTGLVSLIDNIRFEGKNVSVV